MLRLSQPQQNEIRRHGERDYPYECCGLLIGRFEADGAKTVVETYPISNAREEAAKRNRFLIRPQELMRGELYARSRKLDVVGVYHSHPDDTAHPSEFDRDHALPVWSYVIVSIKDGKSDKLLSHELQADRSRFNTEQILEAE